MNASLSNRSLTRQELIRVIERKGNADRVPMLFHMWFHPEVYGERENQIRSLLEEYPYDMEVAPIQLPPVFHSNERNDFSWVKKELQDAETLGIDNRIAIEDWDELDALLLDFPRWYDSRVIKTMAPHGDCYRLGQWWYCLFERLWSLRGMENALTDSYLYPERVHQLFGWLTDFYCKLMERAKNEMAVDGVFTSDDIGTQTGPFFSLEIFREFFKPYYAKLIEKAHSLGIHFWLHTCGNVEAFLPELVELGLDVLHPIQKLTMDAQRVADEWGDKICIWAGVEVQQALPFGTEEDVRTEVRRLKKAYTMEQIK